MSTRPSRARAALGWAGYAGGVLALSVGASELRPEGSSTSLWWPAAGWAVAGALIVPAERRRVAFGLVALVTAVANVLTDRSPAVAVCFGLVNATETAVVVHLLTRGRRRVELAGLEDLWRFGLAALVGAATAAVGAELTLAVLSDVASVALLRSVFTSHLSALVLLVPPVLVVRSSRGDAGAVETAVQTAVLAGLVAYAFGPDQELPLSLLPLVGLVWAAARLAMRTALLQLLAAGLAVTTATLVGWGPYAISDPALSDDPFLTVSLVQAFMIVTALVTLALAVLAAERRDAMAELSELALSDDLTGLPNRRLLVDRLALAARAARHADERFTVLLVDLDGFKAINDTGGHEAGDQVLGEVGRRLVASVRPGDTVARIGGDEFAVVCPGVGPGPAADEIVQRVVEHLEHPVATTGGTFPVSASIGSAHGHGASTPTELLRTADASMYRTKRTRRRRERTWTGS